MILFGGADAEGQAKDDTWAYDPSANTWTNLNSAGDLPAPRVWHTMAYAPAARKVIMFGGCSDTGDPSTYLSDTWAYDPAANTWTALNPPGSLPSKRVGGAFVYDPVSRRILLVGGLSSANPPIVLNDTWAYDAGGNTWTELKPNGADTFAPGPAAAYDPVGARVMNIGGPDASGSLTGMGAYDPAANTWTELKPAGSVPSWRSGGCMVYDPTSGKMVLFGGCANWADPSTYLNDTWAYDPAANTWTELQPKGSVPSARRDYSVAYDPATRRLIMFGGDDADMFFPNDTWAYDPAANTWAELKPSGTTGTTVVASSTTTTAPASKTELDAMMIEQLSPAHAKISSSVLRYPDWSQADKDDFAWAATTIQEAKDRAAGMKAPAGSEESYKHLTAFLDAETKVIKEMKTNADSKAPKILADAGTKLLRQATVELGQLVSPGFVQAIASIPPVPTTAHPGSTEVSGKWNWVVNEMGQEPAATGGSSYIGYETGTWTGTFQGTSHEPFVAWLPDDSQAMWAMLWIHFEDANVNGSHGGLDLRLTAFQPPDGSWFGGEWTVINATGGLEGLQGQGTWADKGGVQYSGTIWKE
jgi:N-acetylneuraminic acid mutarotase